MDRPSSIAARLPQRRRVRVGGRTILRVVLLLLVLAFVHVWENVTVSELRSRLDQGRATHEQLAQRLQQLGGRLVQLTARMEASPGAFQSSGFAPAHDGQVVLCSGGTLRHGAQLAAASSRPTSLWDWIVSSAEAEAREPHAAAAPEELP